MLTHQKLRPKSHVMSLSVIALSLLQGPRGFCWNQSQLSLGEGRVHHGPVTSSLMQGAHQEQFGVQCLAQGHFDMQFSSARWGFEPAGVSLFHSLAQFM